MSARLLPLCFIFIDRPTQLRGEDKKEADAKDWTVEDVASWLRRKGFDQDVCDKFTSVFLLWLVQHHAY